MLNNYCYNSRGAGIRRFLLGSALLLLTANSVSAQKKEIVFSSENLTALLAIDEIKAQTGYVFAFDKSVYDATKVLQFGSKTLDLDNALDLLTGSQNAEYIIRNNVIVITPKAVLQERRQQRVDPVPAVPTKDVYTRNAPGTVSAAPVVRPVQEAPKTVIAVTAPEKETTPPVQYSDYTPIDTYGHVQSATPRFAVKTNVLYAAAAFTPNLAFEFGVGKKSTVEISGSYSWIGRTAAASDNHRQRVHAIVRPEYRWWLCERYNGHFFGVHAIYSRYNVSGYNVPLLFDKENRYDGHAYGAGAAYGYHWAFAKRWGVEFNIGLGYLYMDYDRYSCVKCDRDGTPGSKHYFGPTRAGITLVFMIK